MSLKKVAQYQVSGTRGLSCTTQVREWDYAEVSEHPFAAQQFCLRHSHILFRSIRSEISQLTLNLLIIGLTYMLMAVTKTGLRFGIVRESQQSVSASIPLIEVSFPSIMQS
jgi:hypothetical protein